MGRSVFGVPVPFLRRLAKQCAWGRAGGVAPPTGLLTPTNTANTDNNCRHRPPFRVLDDDLTLDGSACALNKVFAAMRAFDLVLAQPSLCRRPGVFTPYQVSNTSLPGW